MDGADPELVARALRAAATSRPLWVPADGRSMGRTIPGGGEVRIEVADAPRPGEVWAFCDDSGRVIAHRVRGRAGSGYRFRGDAVPGDDPAVAPERLIGRVVATRHDGQVRALGVHSRIVGLLVRLHTRVRLVRRLTRRALRRLNRGRRHIR